jgi:hypothetical protein
VVRAPYSIARSRVTPAVAADFSANAYVPALVTTLETSMLRVVSVVFGLTEPASAPSAGAVAAVRFFSVQPPATE